MISQRVTRSLLLIALLFAGGCFLRLPARWVGNDMAVGYVQSEGSAANMRFASLKGHVSVGNTAGPQVTCPSWSSDFTSFVYAADGDLHIHSVELGSAQIITAGYTSLGAPVWSPNDAGIVFAAQMNASEYGLDLWYLDLASLSLSLLADCSDPTAFSSSCDSPVWIAGHRLIYVRRIEPGQARIETLDLPTGEVETVEDNISLLYADASFGTNGSPGSAPCTVLSVSPDGCRLGLVIGRGSGTLPYGADIHVYDTSTGAHRRITPSRTWADSPAWLDNDHIVFRTVAWGKGTSFMYPHELLRNRTYQIAVLNVETRQMIRVTEPIPALNGGMLSCPFAIPTSAVASLGGGP
jgi:Tol biopolymer transport system component